MGGLCLIQDEVSRSPIVAVVESIRGRALSELNEANVDAVYPAAQLTILGQIRNAGSGDKPTFKRGTDSFPVLGSKCSELMGDRLNELLSSVTASFREEERLDLGTSIARRESRHSQIKNPFFPPAGQWFIARNPNRLVQFLLGGHLGSPGETALDTAHLTDLTTVRKPSHTNQLCIAHFISH